MGAPLLQWLGDAGSLLFRWSLTGFLIVNGIAIAAVIVTRDRALVNRWTARWLGVNLALAASGIGLPLLTTVTRLALTAVMPNEVQLRLRQAGEGLEREE